jgi:outer membrane protein TolC
MKNIVLVFVPYVCLAAGRRAARLSAALRFAVRLSAARRSTVRLFAALLFAARVSAVRLSAALVVAALFITGAGADEIVFSTPQEAVDFALNRNQSRRMEEQNVLLNLKAARFNLGDFLPAFSVSVSEADSTTLASGDSRSRSLQLSVSQTVFDGGQRRRAYEMARLSSLYALTEMDLSRQSFSADILSRYYLYLMQKQRAVIQEDLQAAARQELLIMEKEVSLGLTLETDYLEYYISFIQIENETGEARRTLESQMRQFKIVLELNEEAQLVIADDFFMEPVYFFYEPYQERLWNLIRASSVELKKQDLGLYYARRQSDYSRRWYLPSLSLRGGVSFSGQAESLFPLTEPKYSLSLAVSFSNASLLPLNVNNGYGFEQNRLYNVNNSGDLNLGINPTLGIQKEMAALALVQSAAQRRQDEISLREQVYEVIHSHDASLRAAGMAERTVLLWQRRLEFSRLALETGEKKRIDYLQELITLAQTRIALMEHLVQAASAEQSLEILAALPFGGLRHVCE